MPTLSNVLATALPWPIRSPRSGSKRLLCAPRPGLDGTRSFACPPVAPPCPRPLATAIRAVSWRTGPFPRGIAQGLAERGQVAAGCMGVAIIPDR